jgi:hypothetical protein
MEKKGKSNRRHKCRHSYCPNYYDDVVGKAGWTQHATLDGAECLPCLYANQIADGGKTIEEIEAVPAMVAMFESTLGPMGWGWQDVKDAYQRVKAVAA